MRFLVYCMLFLLSLTFNSVFLLFLMMSKLNQRTIPCLGYVFTYVCLYTIRLHVCMYVYIYIYTCIHIYIYIHVYIYIYMYVCMYVCMYVYIYIYIHTCIYSLYGFSLAASHIGNHPEDLDYVLVLTVIIITLMMLLLLLLLLIHLKQIDLHLRWWPRTSGTTPARPRPPGGPRLCYAITILYYTILYYIILLLYYTLLY